MYDQIHQFWNKYMFFFFFAIWPVNDVRCEQSELYFKGQTLVVTGDCFGQ